MTKRFIFGLILVCSFTSAFAVTTTPAGPFVLMCLSAHPDDEDGATLAYYHEKFGCQTYSVFFTRGEGGQNEIGPELYKDLAIIRTQETENASKILGSHTFFLNFHDFGYSKTATETYANWGGRDEVLRRLVLIIRRIKPDVIMTNHHTWLDNGENHGNHQVVALAALEALEAAADSSYHPEQFKLKGIEPWRVHKLYMRAWDYSDSSKTPAPPSTSAPYSSQPEIVIPVGTMFQGTRVRYQELANKALREHHSQGMEFFQSTVKPDARIWYKLMQADANYPNIPDRTADKLTDNMFSGIIPAERADTTILTAKDIPHEFSTLNYLDEYQPKLYPPQTAKVRNGINVGVIQSYDNTIGDALTHLHVPFTLLDSATVIAGEFSKYTTILVDIRAYGKRKDLAASASKLKEYIVNGGNVVVFYQKTMDWKPEYAPFPFSLTHNRVTDEDATPGLLSPNDLFFKSPNPVTEEDWKGWIVERGLYFPEEVRDYQKIVSFGDPGEVPLKTGLLRTRYGNGSYVYCALSLYRQLRQNHPGAYKLFANLISYHP